MPAKDLKPLTLTQNARKRARLAQTLALVGVFGQNFQHLVYGMGGRIFCHSRKGSLLYSESRASLRVRSNLFRTKSINLGCCRIFSATSLFSSKLRLSIRSCRMRK